MGILFASFAADREPQTCPLPLEGRARVGVLRHPNAHMQPFDLPIGLHPHPIPPLKGEGAQRGFPASALNSQGVPA